MSPIPSLMLLYGYTHTYWKAGKSKENLQVLTWVRCAPHKASKWISSEGTPPLEKGLQQGMEQTTVFRSLNQEFFSKPGSSFLNWAHNHQWERKRVRACLDVCAPPSCASVPSSIWMNIFARMWYTRMHDSSSRMCAVWCVYVCTMHTLSLPLSPSLSLSHTFTYNTHTNTHACRGCCRRMNGVLSYFSQRCPCKCECGRCAACSREYVDDDMFTSLGFWRWWNRTPCSIWALCLVA